MTGGFVRWGGRADGTDLDDEEAVEGREEKCPSWFREALPAR